MSPLWLQYNLWLLEPFPDRLSALVKLPIFVAAASFDKIPRSRNCTSTQLCRQLYWRSGFKSKKSMWITHCGPCSRRTYFQHCCPAPSLKQQNMRKRHVGMLRYWSIKVPETCRFSATVVWRQFVGFIFHFKLFSPRLYICLRCTALTNGGNSRSLWIYHVIKLKIQSRLGESENANPNI